MNPNEVPNKNIITDAKPKRSKKSGEKLTTYAGLTNETQFSKNQQTSMKNNKDNLITSPNTVTKFSVLHQNIRGLLNKSEELIISLFPDSPQILCLTEHHLKHFEIENIRMDHYNLGAKFCRETHKSGGVSIFVHDTLQYTNIKLDEFCKEQDIEACAIKIHLSSLTIGIICIYRSPTGNFVHFLYTLDSILNFVYNHTTEIIICGDFNINFLNDNDKKRELYNLLLSFDLYSTVNFPTRIHNNSSSAIDNIFIDKIKYEDYSIHPVVNGLSDHDAQLITINNITVNKHNKKPQYIRKFNEPSLSQFAVNLSYENWDNVFIEEDINTVFINFLNTYIRIFNASFPLQKTYNTHFNKPWITPGIKTSYQHKRTLYLISRSSDNLKLKAHYKSYCLILAKVITAAKQLYYNSNISKSINKQKTTWDIIKTETGKNQSNKGIQSISIEGNLINNQQLIANGFNTYFLTVVGNITSNLKNDKTSVQYNNPVNYLYKNFKLPCPDMKTNYTTPREIEKIIQSLKAKNSHGYDGIPTKILKISTPFITSPLTYICNKSLSSGIFPSRSKFSEIIPVHKKGNRMDITNFRPISLLTSFSKILEKVIYARLYQHIDQNNILATEQFGFRNNSSTEKASFHLINEVLLEINNKLAVGGLFCDLEKAYDSVNHDILLSKCEFYGFRSKTNALIRS